MEGTAGAIQPEESYRTGEIVEIFYRFSKEEGYFPVPSLAVRCLRPRFGRTDGWMRARVVEDWPESGASTTSIRVRHLQRGTAKGRLGSEWQQALRINLRQQRRATRHAPR